MIGRVAVRRIGDWNAFTRLAMNLERELHLARIQCLRRWSLKAEAVAKGHLSSQDLANSIWQPLSPYTILKKSLAGNSLNTLIETSAYFQSITSWVSVANGVAYVGVKRTATYTNRSGYKRIADVARLQEFGSLAANIPARPLWEPTYNETMKWHLVHNRVGDIFLNNIRKKYS